MTLHIFDPTMMKSLVRITCMILRDNFFYSEEEVAKFLHMFTEDAGNNLDYFLEYGDEDIVDELKRDLLARLHFTCYFTSVHVRQIFLNKMNFTEQELQAFQTILSKHLGEPHERKSRHTRADN